MKKTGALILTLLATLVVSLPALAVPPYCAISCPSSQLCYCARTCQMTTCGQCLNIDEDWPWAPVFEQAESPQPMEATPPEVVDSEPAETEAVEPTALNGSPQ